MAGGVPDLDDLVHRLEEQVDQAWIEVLAALAAQDLHRLLEREGLAVGAVTGEGVEDVCDRRHLSLEGDRTAAS